MPQTKTQERCIKGSYSSKMLTKAYMVRVRVAIVQSSHKAVSGLQLRDVEGGKTRLLGSRREGRMPVPTLITGVGHASRFVQWRVSKGESLG